MLIRTLKATCDEPDCSAEIELDAYTSQPYQDLLRRGWRMGSTALAEETFCPEHAE